MKNLLLTLCLGLGLGLQVQAQSDLLISQYMFNGLVINPAYAGSHEFGTATALVRKQWQQIEGAPLTQIISLDKPTKSKKMGLGLTLSRDQLGQSNQTGLMGSYAYRMPIANGHLGMGIGAGVNQFRSDLTKHTVWDPNDPAFEQDLISKMYAQITAGLYYSTDDYYIGASLPDLANYDFDDGSFNNKDNTLGQTPTYLITAGYAFYINPVLILKPSFLYRGSDIAENGVDINLNALFAETLWLGVSHRLNQGWTCLAELNLSKQLRIGYAYDVNNANLLGAAPSSHEFMVSFDLGYKVKVDKNPRLF